jgi:uncharacterized protein
MIYVFLYFLTCLMGISLGMMGSGGSILLVPTLTYLLSMHPVKAADYSLFVVGIGTLIGTINAWEDIKRDLGIPSIIGIFVMRKLILPTLPKVLLSTSYGDFTLRNLIMVLFAVMMTTVARNMIKPINTTKPIINPSTVLTVCLGLIVGLLSGLLGVGGGFVLVPILVLVYGRTMSAAVSISLLFIVSNSLIGFISAIPLVDMDYTLLVGMSLACVAGMVIGMKWKSRINAQKLKQSFGWFIAFVGIVIFGLELFGNHH